MDQHEAREAAVDQTKIGGNPISAIAFALIYLGDCVRGIETDNIADALRTIGVELGDANVVASQGEPR